MKNQFNNKYIFLFIIIIGILFAIIVGLNGSSTREYFAGNYPTCQWNTQELTLCNNGCGQSGTHRVKYTATNSGNGQFCNDYLAVSPHYGVTHQWGMTFDANVPCPVTPCPPSCNSNDYQINYSNSTGNCPTGCGQNASTITYNYTKKSGSNCVGGVGPPPGGSINCQATPPCCNSNDYQINYSNTSGNCSTDCGQGQTTITYNYTKKSGSTCQGGTAEPTGGTKTTCTATPPCPLPTNYNADFDLYTIVDKRPITLQSKSRLSCMSDNTNDSNCLNIALNKHYAITFQIIINAAGSTSNALQILGITTNANGSDNRVFAAMLQQNQIKIQTNVTEGNNVKTIDLAQIPATVGKNMRIDVLCNYSQQEHQVYVNGNSYATIKDFRSPFYTSGNGYVFASFQGFQSPDATIHDVSLMTSNARTFKIDDLNNVVSYVDDTFRPNQMKEGFTNEYKPLPDGSYSANDIRNMESDLLQQLNDFNRGYANYVKYMYNLRHNQSGDTSSKLALYDEKGISVDDTTMTQNVSMYSNLNQSPIYTKLMEDLVAFNKALQSTGNKSESVNSSVAQMELMEREIKKNRKELDHKLMDLNEVEGSLFLESKQNVYSQMAINVLFTTIATSMIFYIFNHA